MDIATDGNGAWVVLSPLLGRGVLQIVWTTAPVGARGRCLSAKAPAVTATTASLTGGFSVVDAASLTVGGAGRFYAAIAEYELIIGSYSRCTQTIAVKVSTDGAATWNDWGGVHAYEISADTRWSTTLKPQIACDRQSTCAVVFQDLSGGVATITTTDGLIWSQSAALRDSAERPPHCHGPRRQLVCYRECRWRQSGSFADGRRRLALERSQLTGHPVSHPPDLPMTGMSHG